MHLRSAVGARLLVMVLRAVTSPKSSAGSPQGCAPHDELPSPE